MRYSLALLPFLVFLAGCESVPDARPRAELQLPDEPTTDAALQGKWKLVRFDRWGGGPVDTDSVGKTWEITEKEVISPGKFRFDVAGNYLVRPLHFPKQIDVKTADGKKKPGIYSVEGNTLKLCIDDNGGERPTTLASQGKSEIWLFVFERVRPSVVPRE